MNSQELMVDLVDVMTVDKGIVYINGTKITEIEVKELKAEAKFIKHSRIWKIMQETLRQKAIEKAVITSTDFEQVLAGKMMVHSLGIIKSIADVLDEYRH